MTGVLAVVAGLVLVAVGAAAVTTLLRPTGRVERVVTWAVVAAVDVVGSQLLVGAAGLLRLGPLLAVHLGVALLALAVVARRGLLRRRGGPVRPPRLRALVSRVVEEPWVAVLTVLAGGVLGWQLLVALVLPPFAYDALAYHLVDVATWVQTGRLVAPPLNACCAYYPGNAELFSTWAAVLLRSDALVGTVQVVAVVVSCVAVAGIGRSAGLGRAGAIAAADLYCLTPVVLAQAPTAYVDVLQAGLVLAGLYGLTRFAAAPALRTAVVPLLCTGLLTGTKGNGLLWAVALAATGIVTHLLRAHLSRAHDRGSGTLRLPVLLGVGLLCCVLLGGWWYARNWSATGNPLYPFDVRLGRAVVFSGPLRVEDVVQRPTLAADLPWPAPVLASWAADLLPWRHGAYDYQQRVGGLGPLWSWFGAVCFLVTLVRLARRRSGAVLPFVVVALVLVVQPFDWWSRFTMPLAGLGAVAVVAVLGTVRPVVLRRLAELVVLLLALVGVSLVVRQVTPVAGASPLPASRVVGLVGEPASERSIGRLFFPEYAFLDQVPADATVVVDVGAEEVRFVSPLFGARFSRTVVPYGQGPVGVSDWVVTARGRALDDEMSRSRPGPFSDVGGVRVWAPAR